MKFTNTLSLALLAATNVYGFWRMECRGRSGVARIDPLISFGQISDHAHSIHGSSAFGPSATYDKIVAGNCTSCAVTEDLSAYWTPSLYFKDATTGKISLVNQVGGMLSYYFLNYAPGETTITAFPKDFQMIAGDTNRRNFTLPVPDPPKSNWGSDPAQSSQYGLSQKAIGFNCLNYAIAPEGSLYRHFLPDKAYLDANCLDGVRFELMFPSCWNGKDADSANHKDHVAYPDLVIDGTCPTGFPTRLPGLFYEIIWDTYAFKSQAGEFVIANGDPTGYGFHGDFMMGWDDAYLQKAVDTCTNLSGRIQDCPLFTIQDEPTQNMCSIEIPADLATEQVGLSGTIATIPGNPAIQSGPEPATMGSTNQAAPTVTAPNVVVPTLSHSAGSTMPSGSYLPGGVFAALTTATPEPTPSVAAVSIAAAPVVNVAASSKSPDAPVITPAPTTTPLGANQKIYSTSYLTNGLEVMEIIMIEEEVTVTSGTTTTTVEVNGRRRRGAHLHRHNARRFS